MKNPLIPTHTERERSLDRFEMEHHADLQMLMPNFDERLRVHEEKHDPLNEFTWGSLSASGHATATGSADLTVGPTIDSLTITGHPPTVVVGPVNVEETRNVTIALTGVAATAEVGTVGLDEKAWTTEQDLQTLIW